MNDDEIKHLELIQAVIDRMGRNSFMLKGWAVAVVTALVAFGWQKGVILYPLLSVPAFIVFWILDGYFLSQERRFRRLYDAVRKEEVTDEFSMDTSRVAEAVDGWLACIFSKTLVIFYGGFLVSMLVAVLVAI